MISAKLVFLCWNAFLFLKFINYLLKKSHLVQNSLLNWVKPTKSYELIESVEKKLRENLG